MTLHLGTLWFSDEGASSAVFGWNAVLRCYGIQVAFSLSVQPHKSLGSLNGASIFAGELSFLLGFQSDF